MSHFLPTTLPALLLQSNQKIAELIEQGKGLAWDAAHYSTGGIFNQMIGMFAIIFLVLTQVYGSAFDSWGIPGSYGFGIMLTAITVRLCLLPLTAQQIRGMKSMQALQPVMKEIQRYYPDKLNQNAKMMELYSTYKINPLAGCLPMLIQLPILFGVYRALYDPFFAGKEFFGIQLLFPVNVTGGTSFGFGPELVDLIDVTVKTLGLQSQIIRIPQSIPFLGGGFWYTPALILVVLYLATSFWMQRVMKKVNQPDKAFEETFKAEMKHRSDVPEPPDFGAQMQKQMGFMNLIIIVFAFIFSSGAMLYFIVQNALMVVEYSWLPKRMGMKLDPKELRDFIKRPPPPPSSAAAKLPAGKEQGKAGKPAPPENGAPHKVETNLEAGSDENGAEPASGDLRNVPLSRPSRKKRKKR